jgi:Dolichyl-phosphate-mannose-protein mannosyltransferase
LSALFLYGLAVLACLELRPLWLDEVFQLVATTSHTWDHFTRSMGTRNPGAVPLGYLTQGLFVLAGSPSPLWARFPSALFSILSCWVLVQVCRELNLPQITELAAVLFMVMPLQFRYAIEGRPYSEALCFSLLATLAFIKLLAVPTIPTACLCIAATIAGLYTQPYAILSVGGVAFWVAVTKVKQGDWKRAALGPVCLFISLLAFLPWYLLENRKWASGIQQHGIPPFHWTVALGLDVIKGISGDGFLCSAALILLAAVGLFSRAATTGVRGLVLLAIVFPIGGALAGDAFTNYFFASRQILFALPGLVILAALGFSELFSRYKPLALAAAAILLAAALQKDVTMQMKGREDWPAAASAVAEIVRNGRCVQVVPADSLDVYDFFAPGLVTKACEGLPPVSGVALVSHLYTQAAELAVVEKQLQVQGFVPLQTISRGGTTITLEERRR